MSAAEHTGTIGSHGPRVYSREAVLLGCLILLFALFLSTAFISRMYHKTIHGLADDWFAQGEQNLSAGDARQALLDYRNALVYSPDNAKFQFHLAQALAATGRGEEARAYLLNLLSVSPGSGEINLALARIEARKGLRPEALRYYQSAIYGEWETDPIAMRWQIRRELCEYLLDHGAVDQAIPEIIALAGNTPAGDTERMKTVGNFLLRAKLWTRAFDLFHSVLALDKQDEGALLGAGKSAFELGHYDLAAEYLEQLPAQEHSPPDIAQMSIVAQHIQAADPFLPGISTEEKARRAVNALVLADSRVRACAGTQGQSLAETPPRTQLQKVFAKKQGMARNGSLPNLLKHPYNVDETMSLVFEMEDVAADSCGEPEGNDRAIWLLGRGRGAKVQ